MAFAPLQIRLPLDTGHSPADNVSYKDKVITALRDDLDFHREDSGYASHNFHSFPAKFPPQLPRKFITQLTSPGDVVLDLMMGSGTTVVEALLAERGAIGLDIDPLSLLITQVKTTPLAPDIVKSIGHTLLEQTKRSLRDERSALEHELRVRWDVTTHEFIDYWFRPETQLELVALLKQIEAISDHNLRNFFYLAFSSTIITKSGGVSLALDLGHTRPHRVKYAITIPTMALADSNDSEWDENRIEHTYKTIRSPIDEFRRRFLNNIRGLQATSTVASQPILAFGSAEEVPLPDSCVDLIVTSPPYASNAIDYMRAHKFSLTWFGYSVSYLGKYRGRYIGGERMQGHILEDMPDYTASVIAQIASLDAQKGKVLHLYYSQMRRVLGQMMRVLRPGKAAIVVVGSSVMRGRDTETQRCLADIGRSVGFDVPAIGVRRLDRDRRMLPTTRSINTSSQIEQRMHEEYVIALLKPSLS